MRTPRQEKRQWLSEKVRALRRHLDLTQDELARQMGTRQQTISEWETGAYAPRGASATLLNVIAERADFAYSEGAALDEPGRGTGAIKGRERKGGRKGQP